MGGATQFLFHGLPEMADRLYSTHSVNPIETNRVAPRMCDRRAIQSDVAAEEGGLGPLFSAKEIQTRWRSLKDCFRRELHLQKKESRSGSSPSKRKRYMFYDQLTFLEPTLMRRSSSGKASDTQESPKSEGSDSEPPQSPLPERIAQIPEPPRTKRNKTAGSGLGDFESQIIGMVDSLKKKKDSEKDEDYLFVQSLLPYLKKVPEEKKIDLQIDILQLVKTYMHPSSSQPLPE